MALINKDHSKQITKSLLKAIPLKCPSCAKGRIFENIIKVKPAEKCSSCGMDFSKFDIGDAPSFFSIFSIGFLIPLLAILVEVYFQPSLTTHMLIWIPATFIFCIFTLTYVRSLFIHMEYKINQLNNEKNNL